MGKHCKDERNYQKITGHSSVLDNEVYAKEET